MFILTLVRLYKKRCPLTFLKELRIVLPNVCATRTLGCTREIPQFWTGSQLPGVCSRHEGQFPTLKRFVPVRCVSTQFTRNDADFAKDGDQLGESERRMVSGARRAPKHWISRERQWLEDLVTSSNLLSPQQWTEAKVNAQQQGLFREGHFESRVMVACSRVNNFALGKSLMNYMESEQLTPNLVTLSKYLRLCGECEGEANEKQIMALYHRLTDNQTLLDGGTAEDIIYGLCRTSAWKESLRFLDMVRRTCLSPSQSCLQAVILAAFRNRAYDDGWALLKELASTNHGHALNAAVYGWIQESNSEAEDRKIQMMDKLLALVKSHEVVVSRAVAEAIKFHFESRQNEEWAGSFTTILRNGTCQSCESRLESITLDDGEFEELRRSFIERVIEGNDVFLKSTPAEVDRFRYFVEKTGPYSVVLDGLNVAYHMSRRRASRWELAKQLLRVVQEFAGSRSGNQKMLILGRQHMKEWPRDILQSIKKDAYIFTVENLSEDDPFLLYAAMYSGQGTRFLSKDLMRDHSFCLGDARLKSYFRRWQRGHQLELLNVSAATGVHFKRPVKYNPVAQVVEGRWHIPFREEPQKHSLEICDSWICLKNSTSHRLTKSVVKELLT